MFRKLFTSICVCKTCGFHKRSVFNLIIKQFISICSVSGEGSYSPDSRNHLDFRSTAGRFPCLHFCDRRHFQKLPIERFRSVFCYKAIHRFQPVICYKAIHRFQPVICCNATYRLNPSFVSQQLVRNCIKVGTIKITGTHKKVNRMFGAESLQT